MEDCNTGVVNHHEAKEKAMKRLYGLLDLQKEVERRFGDTGYNVFVFGSYLTIKYREGQGDIDIAIYSEDFERSCQQKLKEAKRKVIK